MIDPTTEIMHDTIGSIGEEEFRNNGKMYMAQYLGVGIDKVLFTENGESMIVNDVTDQRLKHDFEVEYGTDKIMVDIKTDSGTWQRTGNIVLEVYNPFKPSKAGWLLTTTAHAICFCLSDGKERPEHMRVIMASVAAMRRMVEDNNYKLVYLPKGSKAYCVPIDDILACKPGAQFWLKFNYVRGADKNERI